MITSGCPYAMHTTKNDVKLNSPLKGPQFTLASLSIGNRCHNDQTCHAVASVIIVPDRSSQHHVVRVTIFCQQMR